MNSRSIAPSVAIVVAMISSITLAQTVETEVGRLQPSQSDVGDYLGTSVAVDGNLIVVGSPWSDGSVSNGGSAFVWEWNEVNWDLVGSLDPLILNPDDLFGASV
ncbi:MAG: FG-GAP repeat protein, partial [Phycisphaerales bacterium]|nr:FG-GAP repeat protein [Phycisphaerales bacterium]